MTSIVQTTVDTSVIDQMRALLDKMSNNGECNEPFSESSGLKYDGFSPAELFGMMSGKKNTHFCTDKHRFSSETISKFHDEDFLRRVINEFRELQFPSALVDQLVDDENLINFLFEDQVFSDTKLEFFQELVMSCSQNKEMIIRALKMYSDTRPFEIIAETWDMKNLTYWSVPLSWYALVYSSIPTFKRSLGELDIHCKVSSDTKPCFFGVTVEIPKGADVYMFAELLKDAYAKAGISGRYATIMEKLEIVKNTEPMKKYPKCKSYNCEDEAYTLFSGVCNYHQPYPNPSCTPGQTWRVDDRYPENPKIWYLRGFLSRAIGNEYVDIFVPATMTLGSLQGYIDRLSISRLRLTVGFTNPKTCKYDLITDKNSGLLVRDVFKYGQIVDANWGI